MKASFFQLALAALLPTMIAAASSARQRCFVEPFPGMLEAELQNYRACGLNNPHVIDYVCEPVRGLVPDALWLDWQLQQFEAEAEIEQEAEVTSTEVKGHAFPAPSHAVTLPETRYTHPPQNAGFLAQAAALAVLFGSSGKL